MILRSHFELLPAVLGIVLLATITMGVSSGVGADSLMDARIDEQMGPENIEDGQEGTWRAEFAIAMGNMLFWVADKAAVFGYHNKWISPSWLSVSSQVLMLGTMTFAIYRQLRRIAGVVF